MVEPATKRNNVTTINVINDDILCYIVTFLPLIEAVRASIISRRWRNLWKFNPRLIINRHDYFHIDSLTCKDGVISSILDSHKTKLECCEINHDTNDVREGRVLQWVTRLKESHHVQHLTLINGESSNQFSVHKRVVNDFDQNLFASFETLQVLKLHQYMLSSGSAFEGCVNLTTLNLSHVKLYSSATIAEILSNCPRLTKLSLMNCFESSKSRWKDLTLCSDKLEYLELTHFIHIYKLRIDAVRLSTLVLDLRHTLFDCCINTPKLVTFRLDDACARRFLSYPIGFKTNSRFSFRHKGLENLHYLSIALTLSYKRNAELLYRTFQVCVHLEKLTIVNQFYPKDPSQPLQIENTSEYDGPCTFWDENEIGDGVALNLRVLEISRFRADRLEVEFVRYAMSHATLLKSLILRYDVSCSREVIDTANRIVLAHPRASGTAAMGRTVIIYLIGND